MARGEPTAGRGRAAGPAPGHRATRSPRPMFRAALPQLDADAHALLRSCIEGVGAADAWLRFGTDGSDGRVAHRRVEALLADIELLALAHGLPGVAQTFGLQMRALLAQQDLPPPPGEDRRQRASRLQRRRRQRDFLLSTLETLRTLTPRDPRAPFLDDPLALWCLGHLPGWFASAGVHTLDGLRAFMRTHGHRWYERVPHLGAKKAARLIDWWSAQSRWLGPLEATITRPRRELPLDTLAPPARLDLVPLERFAPPQDARSGAEGSNRASLEHCQLQARNDYEAVQAWLSRKPAGSATWRAYRREAERFLLWAVLERGKALSSLSFEDCIAYREFLRAPPTHWVRPGRRQHERFTPDWRPFAGPLSATSLHTAQVILRTMCQFLKDANYMATNPWSLVPQDAPDVPRAQFRVRSLSEEQWAQLLAWVDDDVLNPPTAATQRLRFMFRLAYTTGLRLSELSAARVGDLSILVDQGERFWMLSVLGKGKKTREVPLPDPTVEALRRYLRERGLSPGLIDAAASNADRGTPLLAHTKANQPLGSARIYEIFKDAFMRCAAHLEASDARAASSLRKASTHWLRHTYGTHAIAREMDLTVVQGNMGHAAITTTQNYLTAGDAARARATRKAFGQAP